MVSSSASPSPSAENSRNVAEAPGRQIPTEVESRRIDSRFGRWNWSCQAPRPSPPASRPRGQKIGEYSQGLARDSELEGVGLAPVDLLEARVLHLGRVGGSIAALPPVAIDLFAGRSR